MSKQIKSISLLTTINVASTFQNDFKVPNKYLGFLAYVILVLTKSNFGYLV